MGALSNPLPPEVMEAGRLALRLAAIHLSRLAYALVCTLSATYLLLCFIPFTNQNFIQGQIIAWLPTFVALQPYLFALLSAAVVAATLPRFGFGRSSAWSFVLGVVLGAYSLWMFVASPLDNAGMDPGTLSRASWMFVPLALVGLIDIPDASRRLIWTSSRGAESARQFQTMLVAAIAVTLVFFTVAIVRAPRGTLSGGEALAVGITGFWTQLVIAACVFTGLALVRSVAAFFYRSAFAEAVLLVSLGGFALASAVVSIVLEPLSLEGLPAWMLALVASGSAALLVYGTGIRHCAKEGNSGIGSGVDLVVAGLGVTPGIPRRVLAWAACVTAVSLAAGAVSLAGFDWSFLQQKLLVIAAWTIFAAIFYRIIPVRDPAPDATIVWLEFCALIIGGHYALDRLGGRIPALAGGGDLRAAELRWRSWDVAYRLGRDAVTLEPAVRADDFYAFLRSYTNISRAKQVSPVDVEQVQRLEPKTGPRPHIFIFVVDSLRRDYVGAVNRNVTFTPSLDALAGEGVSFRNAFARYGATGLSEPSIWVGGMLLHKQYVEPFHPMNSLQKLLEWERYREVLGHDPILDAIVRDGPTVTRLPSVGPGEQLCGQLELLKEKVGPLAGSDEPVFAYLQPLDLHIASIRRDGANVPKGETYPGFHAPYAWRVRRLDQCLGQFFDFLREKGMWESSMVVVTADHGDALSEGGQWGHAYSIAPEILRVPLIVKLPRTQQRSLKADRDAIAFVTDVTPTIHYVLGHRPIHNDEMLGRPLFTEELKEQKPYFRGDYLVASSYGPVWGILGENGRRLYVADAINFRDTVYEIPPDGLATSREPDPGETRRAQALLREKIQAIADLYRFTP
ncbi:MAG: sulfatase-like hydrolase/transferase [Acidobacteria bacterium]|nr:sulfatase-like hydrolase/transferase [Acidobacteriota bacterium]